MKPTGAKRPPAAAPPSKSPPARAAAAKAPPRGATSEKTEKKGKAAVAKSAPTKAPAPAAKPPVPRPAAAKAGAASSAKSATTKAAAGKAAASTRAAARSAGGAKPAAEKAAAARPGSGKAPAAKQPAAKTGGAKVAATKTVAAKTGAGKAAATKGAAKTTRTAGAAGERKPPRGTPANARSVAAAAAAAAPTTDAHGYVVINGRRVRMISTKDIQRSKKSRTAEAAAGRREAPALDIAAIKTRLSKKELDHYRDLLLERRNEILGLVRGMEQEALRSEGGNLSHMPIHMADIGTDTADQDFALSLAEKERQTINEIDAALQRIADGSYGVCQATGKPIPKARLDAKPWAKYTIEAARMVESGHRF